MRGVQVPDVDGLRMAREQVVSTVSYDSSVQLSIRNSDQQQSCGHQ